MLTRAESTGYRETSLHADVMRFVADLDALGDPRLHVSDFGRSPGGRELPLLILSRDGLRTPEEARRSGRPVVLMQDGIHPGEVEGKEASLALVRDLLDGRVPELEDLLRRERWVSMATLRRTCSSGAIAIFASKPCGFSSVTPSPSSMQPFAVSSIFVRALRATV